MEAVTESKTRTHVRNEPSVCLIGKRTVHFSCGLTRNPGGASLRLKLRL
jgi:hypothetical protein